MGKFNSKSPKPHVLFSNDYVMLTEIFQKAGYLSRNEAKRCPVRTSKAYVDKSGVKRSVGLKKELKDSQFLVRKFRIFCWFSQARVDDVLVDYFMSWFMNGIVGPYKLPIPGIILMNLASS